MPNYESLAWAIGMMKRFTHVPSILKNIQGWGTSPSRIMVMAATEDKLVKVRLMEDTVREYRKDIKQLSGQKKIEPYEDLSTSSQVGENTTQNTEIAVTMVVVNGAGHHVQNDVQADEAAEALRMFLEQL